MPVQITIRNVPDEVRDSLASRAAREGKSMQEFLKSELERMAARPSVADWVDRVRERKNASGRRVSRRSILRHRDSDRR